jgi:hypothetical protein
MAFRGGDSFDYYSTSQLTARYTNVVFVSGGTTVTIDSNGRFGQGLKIVGGFLANTYVLQVYDNQSTWIVGFALNLSQIPTASLQIAGMMDGATKQVELAVNSSGNLVISRNGTVLGTSTNILTAPGFNYIEWKMTISSSISAHTCKARVNSVDWIDLAATTNTKNSSNATANGILLGDTFGNTTHANAIYDDHYVLDGTGSNNNDFWGDIKALANYSTANGNYTSFSFTGAGSAHAAVSENPPDGDTSYVFSSSVNSRESFTFPAPSDTLLAAFAAQTILYAKKQGSGSRSIIASLRSGSTDYDGSNVDALSTSYVYYVEARDENPATSAAWTTTDFNAGMELGIKIQS